VVDNKVHITVCIPTYKRPKLLARCMEALRTQERSEFDYSIVVVDNDVEQTAKEVVYEWQKRSPVKICYYVEPEKNIALARNKAVENAKGNLIAFIDDDEFPETNWLLTLYKTYINFNSDGVLGPVKPYFEGNPPNWLVKGKFCERKIHKTGTLLHWGETRTGNVLINRSIFVDKRNRFESQFGRTGGEDIEFFKKVIGQGKVFIWCNEAIVYEVVGPDRWKRSFYLKKFLRIGGLTGEKIRCRGFEGIMYFLKVGFVLILFTTALPFSVFLGHHVFIKILVKLSYSLGWISGFLGYPVLRYRGD